MWLEIPCKSAKIDSAKPNIIMFLCGKILKYRRLPADTYSMCVEPEIEPANQLQHHC